MFGHGLNNKYVKFSKYNLEILHEIINLFLHGKNLLIQLIPFYIKLFILIYKYI